jgi:hypothetical protein
MKGPKINEKCNSTEKIDATLFDLLDEVLVLANFAI